MSSEQKQVVGRIWMWGVMLREIEKDARAIYGPNFVLTMPFGVYKKYLDLKMVLFICIGVFGDTPDQCFKPVKIKKKRSGIMNHYLQNYSVAELWRTIRTELISAYGDEYPLNIPEEIFPQIHFVGEVLCGIVRGSGVSDYDKAKNVDETVILHPSSFYAVLRMARERLGLPMKIHNAELTLAC